MAETIEGWGSQFFEDQHVLPDDLNMIEYSKTRLFRNYIKAKTRQAGVLINSISATDLQVTTSDGTTFSVNAGTAIDYDGRLIVVPNNTSASGSSGDDPAYHPAWPDRQGLSTGITQAGTYYINLRYAEQTGDTRHDDVGESHQTRVYDSYSISVEDTRAGITLAEVRLDASGHIVEDTTETGYINSTTGTYYSLFDDRPLYKATDGAVGALETQVASNTDDLDAEIRKSAGFLYPASGQALTDKWARDVTLLRMEVFAEGASGNVTFQLYSGSSPDVLDSPLTVVSATAGSWTSSAALNLTGYKGDTLRVYVSSADSTITAATCSLVYTRR